MAFAKSSDFAIHGGAHNVVYGVQDIGHTTNYIGDSDKFLELLTERVAPNAFFDSEQRFPPPNCHPGTRAAILQKLSHWIEDDSRTTRVFWLYGSAGVGKSAIAQNLSEKYINSRLAASFFFSRNDSSRAKLDPFVPTIAYQLSKSEPLGDLLGPLIKAVIRGNPSIFHKSHELQFRKLILEPISEVYSEARSDLPILIIIDGLDECVLTASQERLLAIIRAATTSKTPTPLIFLICSRPEPRIRDSFDHAEFRSVLSRLGIGVSYESDQDIETYLRYEFTEIRRKHHRIMRNIDSSWPGDRAIHQLVQRANGQFIYVTTVIKFVGSDDGLPTECLDTILDTPAEDIPSSPYPDLDLLYRQILSPCLHHEKILQILRLLVTPDSTWWSDLDLNRKIHWRSSWVIERLLEFKQGEVGMLLFQLHSVLHIPDEEDDQIIIPHASFTEFLLDSRRSLHYHVRKHSSTEYSDLVTRLLLRSLSVTKSLYPLRHHQTSVDIALSAWRDHVHSTFRARSTEDKLRAFASIYWASYCQELDSPSPDLVAALEDFDPYSYFAMVFNHCLLSWSESRISDPQSFSNLAHDLDRQVEQFRTVVSFAKTSRPRVPWNFVRRSESFLRQCVLGFNAVDLKSETLTYWLYFMLVLRLYFPLSRYHMKGSILSMLTSRLGRGQMWATPLEEPVPLIAPADSKLVPPLTSSWVFIQASQESSIVWFKRFLPVFLENHALLEQDPVKALEDAKRNAGCNLVKLWHLRRMKKLITKDRKLLEAKLRDNISTEDGLENVSANPSPPGEGIESPPPGTGVHPGFAQGQDHMLAGPSNLVASERIISHQATEYPQPSRRRDIRHKRVRFVEEPSSMMVSPEWRSDAD